MDQHDLPLETLYGVYRSDLLRFLVARTGDTDEAEDLIQELWLRVRQPQGGPVAHGRAYLYRMAQNLVVDRLRARQRRLQRERLWSEEHVEHEAGGAEAIDSSPTAEDDMLRREEAARLVSAMATLPDGARRVFELHKIQGMSHSEVAATLGISRSGVEKHMAVAIKYLRRAMFD